MAAKRKQAAPQAPPARSPGRDPAFGFYEAPPRPTEEMVRQPRRGGRVAPEMHALRAAIFVSAFSLTAGACRSDRARAARG